MIFRNLISGMTILFFITLLGCSQENSYTTTDPAILEMEMSLDMPRGPAPTGSAMIAPRTNMPAAAGISMQNIAGAWHLDLTNGESIDLILSQSGNIAFGRGSLTSGTGSTWVTASGFISGNILRLDVVPSSGTGLYAIALDMSTAASAGTYSIFIPGGSAPSGTVRWTRSAAYR